MINRRNFMLSSSAAAVTVSGSYFSGKAYAEGDADIGIATGSNIEAIVRAAVASVGGIGKFVKPGNMVAIKPNLSFASPVKRAATTNPEVVSAVVKLCLEAGAKRIIVMDHPLQDAAIIGDKAEVAQVVSAIDGATMFLPTTENMYREKKIPLGKEMKTTQTITMLDEMDVLINLPIAKNHSATAVSIGIKGNLGLVYDRIAYHNSGDFHQSLADLATILKADLTIVDVVRALATRGPQGPGKVLKLDTIIAGTDPVAVDAQTVALTWAQWNLAGSNVEHLVKSAEMGLGEIDPSKLNVVRQTI